MFQRGPSPEKIAEMRFWGLTPADYPEYNRTVEVCPDNWQAVQFMSALGMGSWNVGFGGPIGLRYETFREVRMALGVKGSEWPALFDQIKVMERVALDEMHKDD